MRTTALLGLAVGVVGLAGAAVAQPAGPSSTAVSSDNDPNRIVCHSRPAPTGSRLGGTSECHTQKQWDDMRQQSQATVNSIQLHGLNTIPPGH
jgi:cytochrome c5